MDIHPKCIIGRLCYNVCQFGIITFGTHLFWFTSLVAQVPVFLLLQYVKIILRFLFIPMHPTLKTTIVHQWNHIWIPHVMVYRFTINEGWSISP